MSLEALERSDLSRLPGGIFTRSFIRAYAQEVGLDPDRTIQDFIAELPPETATATAHAVGIEDSEKLESDRKAVATALRLALVSLPIIGLVIYYGTHRTPASRNGTAASHEARNRNGHARRAAIAGDRCDARHVGGGAGRVATDVGTINGALAPRRCWVSVNADGEPVFSGLMNAGDKRVVNAKELIVLNVGDAGGFAYTLNGRAGKALGAPGDVISTRITPANVQNFLTP